MKTLVLAEKPSVGRELARILGCKQNGNGCLIGSNYIVTWALGHLVTLATPEEYFDSWQEWKLETLPMIPKKFKTTVIKQTSKQFGVVKNLLHNNEINELIIATDAGREGELVARWIINKVGFNKNIKRLWISSMTDQSIKQGLNSLRSAREYDNLFHSAEARAIADWLIGLNVTRALTCKYNAQLSAGRVQTPTLAMIVTREDEIKKFVPKPFYRLNLLYNGVNFIYTLPSGESRIDKIEDVDLIIKRLYNKQGIINAIDYTNKREPAPLLYDLTELQRDANKLYGYSPKQTLDIMQKLYEQHKYLTYPRTDSRYLTSDMEKIVPTILKNFNYGEYQKHITSILQKPLKNNKRIYDNSKVTDHHAIIPTEQKPNLHSLSLEELRIYELVVKRFICVFLDDYEYMNTVVKIKIDDYEFLTKGKTILKLGYKEVYKNINLDDESDNTQKIPNFKKLEVVKNYKLNRLNEQTVPPARYTQATLLTAMEHPGKFVENKLFKDILEKASGIGTPATRAEIIEKLFNVGYMELKGKSIYPTSKGTQLIALVPDELKSPLLTAKWEERLQKIGEGKENYVDFISDIEHNSQQLVEKISIQNFNYKHDNATKSKCPNCGKVLIEIKNKNGSMLACSDRNCGYKKYLMKTSNARCPECHKKLNIVGASDKKYYQCQCGFKEKCDSFHEKLQKRGNEMNKYELNDYLRKEKKELPVWNAFEEALKNKE